MPLTPGTTLGSYSVTAKIGEGGMGEVYRARDTKLDRDVALKVLPPAFTDDPDRLARFEREAKVLASLNHPNIGGIHGLEESDGIKALVLEYIEGPTLADRVKQGPIPVDEALPIAKQIAEALEAAHEQGVIHRDLKPANIKVRDDGTVKVLDFGLAKAMQPDASDPSMSQSPTISLTAAATQMGMVIGTPAYMAPEQAKGHPADKRADIWAFGAVLFEMLTGKKLFEAGDVSEMLASVLVKDPDISSIGQHVPDHVRSVVRRCLVKDPKERLRDMGDVRLAMKGMFETSVTVAAEPMPAAQLNAWQRPVPILTFLLVIAGIAFLAGALNPAVNGPADQLRFVITPSEIAPLFPITQARNLTISPDGREIIYVTGEGTGATPLLVRRELDQLTEVPLNGTEGGIGPFLSPDGEWVGFLDRARTTLYKVPIFGGPPETIVASVASIYGATWGINGDIIFGTDNGLYRVAEGGREPPELLTMPDTERGETGHSWPALIPGSNALVFVVSSGLTLTTGRLAVLRLDTGEVTLLGLSGVSPYYVPTGHLVYANADGSILAVPFDTDRLEVTGNPVLVLENVQVMNGGGGLFSISNEGRLVYLVGSPQGSRQGSLVWVNRDGEEETIGAERRAYAYPRISPDGSKIAVSQRDQDGGIWIWDVERENLSALTTEGRAVYGNWTPDGRRIIFRASGVRTGVTLFATAADGTGSAEPIFETASSPRVEDITPDGRGVVISGSGRDGTPDLSVLWLDGNREPEVLIGTPFAEQNGALSPDGGWLAYESNASGRLEIYARPFPDVGGRQELISSSGGLQPLWSKDGRELFFREGNRLMSVPVQISPDRSFGSPEVVFEGEYSFAPGRNYDVSADRRFLMVKNAPLPSQITVVTNWFQELTERVPVN